MPCAAVRAVAGSASLDSERTAMVPAAAKAMNARARPGTAVLNGYRFLSSSRI